MAGEGGENCFCIRMLAVVGCCSLSKQKAVGIKRLVWKSSNACCHVKRILGFRYWSVGQGFYSIKKDQTKVLLVSRGSKGSYREVKPAHLKIKEPITYYILQEWLWFLIILIKLETILSIV